MLGSEPIQDLIKRIAALETALNAPFYLRWDFIISQVLALIGLWITYEAYRQAKRAKEAAITAASTVKSITVAMELQEIAQNFDKLDENISYSTCRDLYAYSSRKIKQLVTPYRADSLLGNLIVDVEQRLDIIRSALDSVRPISEISEGPTSSIYNAVEGPFSALADKVGELVGNFEKRSVVNQHK